MVKKKRQSDPGENGDESTESCDENVKSACPQCPHVAKAVDLNRLKKCLKAGGFDKECIECTKLGTNDLLDPDFDVDMSLWMCLRCGSQLCGRSRNRHALRHFLTPHSDCHAITTNTSSWEVYCYDCKNEVTASSSKKLHECVEYVKKQAAGGNSKSSLPPIELSYEDTNSSVDGLKTEYVNKPKDKTSLNQPRVRGLSNLGNTCFFNSVMQCLVQTPYLLQVLQDMKNPGEKFTLPGGKLKLKADGDDEGKEVELPPIAGELSEWGPLARTLAETLEELQTGEGGVYTPRKLLSALVTKLPQFGGGDQHDAHELLRHLLEAVRSEDLRRYQSVILTSLGMSSKVDPSKVDGEVKQKVKFYGQQASDTMLRPEQVFRGFLVSTLECQECFHQSHRSEYFLDLSLPVAAYRPQPPVALRKAPNEDNPYNMQEDGKPSKHRLKKERTAARKAARKNKGNSTSKDGKPGEENGKDDKSSSESDADVEDNLEDLPRREHSAQAPQEHTAANFAYYMESGYNSEKVISSDSIRTSPVELEKTDGPERTDKDKVEYADSTTSTTAVPLEYKPLVSLENLSNPDSGVASPEATKHNSTETVDHVDSPGEVADSPQDHERPVSRIAFAPQYSNEVVARGISVRGSRSLLEPLEPVEPVEPALERLRLEPSPASRRRPTAPPPCQEDECSVQSCLSSFTALELLTGNNKVGCETCTARLGPGARTVYTNATKRFLVSSAPAVMILHLKRFQLGPRCMFRKMSKHVEFPLELEPAPFCRGGGGGRGLRYALYGVVEHSGGMHGGHYVAYVKLRAPVRPNDARWAFLPRSGPPPAEGAEEDSELSGYESGDGESGPPKAPPGRWYYVSDSCVSEVSEEKVLRAQAYLLFYERIL